MCPDEEAIRKPMRSYRPNLSTVHYFDTMHALSNGYSHGLVEVDPKRRTVGKTQGMR